MAFIYLFDINDKTGKRARESDGSSNVNGAVSAMLASARPAGTANPGGSKRARRGAQEAFKPNPKAAPFVPRTPANTPATTPAPA